MRIAIDHRDKRLLRCWNRECEVAYATLRWSGPCFQIETPSDWHEHKRAWVRIGLGIARVAFSFPWRGHVPKDDGQCSGPTYGFAFHDSRLWIYTGKSTSRDHAWITIPLPWDWHFIRHDYLWPDGQLHHRAGQREYEKPKETKRVYPYMYTLKSGKVQPRAATVNGEEMEWRWNWLRFLPWPRKINRFISVEFSDEVGERSGSWKGGVIGCSTEWRHGETMESALQRMERERKFG